MYSGWLVTSKEKRGKKIIEKKMGIEILYPKIIGTKKIKHGGVF